MITFSAVGGQRSKAPAAPLPSGSCRNRPRRSIVSNPRCRRPLKDLLALREITVFVMPGAVSTPKLWPTPSTSVIETKVPSISRDLMITATACRADFACEYFPMAVTCEPTWMQLSFISESHPIRITFSAAGQLLWTGRRRPGPCRDLVRTVWWSRLHVVDEAMVPSSFSTSPTTAEEVVRLPVLVNGPRTYTVSPIWIWSISSGRPVSDRTQRSPFFVVHDYVQLTALAQVDPGRSRSDHFVYCTKIFRTSPPENCGAALNDVDGLDMTKEFTRRKMRFPELPAWWMLLRHRRPSVWKKVLTTDYLKAAFAG